MYEIKKLVFKAIKQGVKDSSPEITPFVIQANINGLIFFGLDLFLAFIFFITLDDPHISYGLLASGSLFLIGSVGFNSLGWTTLSRLSTVLIGSLLVVYCALYLGAESFASASLLTGAIFPFVYFSLNEKKLLAACISVPVICFGFLLMINYHWGPQIHVANPITLHILQIVFFLVPFVGIVTNTYTAVLQREHKTEELAESQHLLKTIFNALFHDLANPAMLVFMIADGAFESQTMSTKMIDRLYKVSEQMKRVLNKLKKMTMISGGKNQLQYEKLRLSEVVAEAVQFSQNQAHGKGVNIIIEPCFEEIWINVDRDIFIFQVLMNFLSNAIKFTESGKSVIVATQKNDQNVSLEIRDQGIGIDPQRIETLMSWKNQTSTTGTNGEKGTGLGLPLAHRFLQFMGGDISIQSFPIKTHPLNHGTIIKIELPVVAGQEKNLVSEPIVLSQAS